MVAGEWLREVKEFIRAHLRAEAELSRAALEEPDDDAYLEKERHAETFYAPSTTPLGPLESRSARPGGTNSMPTVEVGDTIRPGTLYALGSAGPDVWIALVGDRRDLDGWSIAEALLVRRTSDGLRITGRAGVNPFSSGVQFEPAGGEPVDARAVQDVERLQAPQAADHAAFLREWGS